MFAYGSGCSGTMYELEARETCGGTSTLGGVRAAARASIHGALTGRQEISPGELSRVVDGLERRSRRIAGGQPWPCQLGGLEAARVRPGTWVLSPYDGAGCRTYHRA
mmetsp:Transcript_307/g.1015  ORF Transcript_307/g.1015 Transcript_307/m.1015 type:complete len:107 (+) Transcript_307:3419-3739(+)